MRTLLPLAALMLLASCASGPTVHTSFDGYGYTSGPSSADDPRLLNPKFYMNDDKSIAEPYTAPPALRFHGDNFCTANCQAHGGGADYCYRACGI